MYGSSESRRSLSPFGRFSFRPVGLSLLRVSERSRASFWRSRSLLKNPRVVPGCSLSGRDNRWVQGSSRVDRELMDAAGLVGHLVPAGSVFAFLGEHRREVFPVSLFEDLFPSSTGRPSLPGEVAAAVLVLQTLHDLSDRDAVQAVRCDLRWKVACGLPLDHEGFHPSTLTYWRRRLAASDRPDRIFDAVRAVIDQTGVLKGKTRRALDSVVLDDAVATQDTVTQLVSAIRRVSAAASSSSRSTIVVGTPPRAHKGNRHLCLAGPLRRKVRAFGVKFVRRRIAALATLPIG